MRTIRPAAWAAATHCVATPFGSKASLGACRPRARSRPSTRDHAPCPRADTGSVGLDRRELRHQRRHLIDDAVAREDFKGLERAGRRPGMTRISKAMAEGADLSAFVDQRLILARGQPARLLARPPVGRLAIWPGPPGDSIRLKRPGPREGSRQQQLTLVSNDEPFRFVGGNGFAQKIG